MTLLSRGLISAGILWACALPLRAAEDVTLSSGFHLLCQRREVANGKIRLYTSSDNFIEVDPSEVVSVESVPDAAVPSTGFSSSMNQKAAQAAVVAPAAQTAGRKSDYRESIARAGGEHNVDVDLLSSVIRAESGGNPRAVSAAGALGLMQLMPDTAAQLGVTDSFRPEQNIDGGTAYLDALLLRYHDNLALALAAYNAGPAAVDRYRGVPPYPETRRYVANVIREFNRRKKAEALHAGKARGSVPVESAGLR